MIGKGDRLAGVGPQGVKCQPICTNTPVLAAARAAEKDNGDDDEPYPVVVKKIAKTVVIHNVPSFRSIVILSRLCAFSIS